MPRVPDASMATTFVRVQATVPTAPTIQSRTYVRPHKGGYLNAILRATDVGQDMAPSQSVLGIPQWKSPQFVNGRFFLK